MTESPREKRKKLDVKGEESSKQPTLVEKLELFVETGGTDLTSFLRSNAANTPPPPVEMQVFNEKSIKENIIKNFYNQNRQFLPTAAKNLTDFFRVEFETTTRKIFLQLLIHVSKADFEENVFNEILATYLVNGQNDLVENHIICAASAVEAEKIKTFIKSPVCITAIENNIRFFFGETLVVKRDRIIKLINVMNIYFGNFCNCFPQLRGSCLIDGIVLFRNLIARNQKEESVGEADLATLAIHEAIHFILRCLSKNFNMSSPFKTMDTVRKDSSFPTKNLEMGRKIEYDLFSGVRPNWIASSPGAATEFLKRLKEPKTTLPIIKEEEFLKIGLVPRTTVSASFACDFVPQATLC